MSVVSLSIKLHQFLTHERLKEERPFFEYTDAYIEVNEILFLATYSYSRQLFALKELYADIGIVVRTKNHYFRIRQGYVVKDKS